MYVCCVQGEDGFPGAKGEMGAKGDTVMTHNTNTLLKHTNSRTCTLKYAVSVRETPALQGCVVRMVLRAPKGRVAPWVKLDPRASLEKRCNIITNISWNRKKNIYYIKHPFALSFFTTLHRFLLSLVSLYSQGKLGVPGLPGYPGRQGLKVKEHEQMMNR